MRSQIPQPIPLDLERLTQSGMTNTPPRQSVGEKSGLKSQKLEYFVLVSLDLHRLIGKRRMQLP